MQVPAIPGAAGTGEALAALRQAAAHVFVEDLDDPVLAEEDRHHLRRVLRLRPGERVSVADGNGGWRLCAYPGGGGPGGGPGDGRLEPLGERRQVPSATPEIILAFAPTKGDRPEWAVQKLTEIGVDRIVPLRTRHSVVRWDEERGERHLARWSEVARQAAMQSRRLRLPVIEAPRTPAELIVAGDGGGVALATPGGGPPSLQYATVLVGPEGGWTVEEERDAPAQVSLGPFVLRTETAAVVAAAFLSGLRSALLRQK